MQDDFFKSKLFHIEALSVAMLTVTISTFFVLQHNYDSGPWFAKDIESKDTSDSLSI